MAKIFQQVHRVKPQRSNFDLSHEVKTTTEFGRLTPVLCQEVLPGDTFEVKSDVFARCAPMLAPIMHRVDVYVHYFFIPNRLVWDHWKEFRAPRNYSASKQPSFPKLEIWRPNYIGPSSLADYLGFPAFDKTMNSLKGATWNRLPFAAYQLVYNEYYRDQTLHEPAPIFKEHDGTLFQGTPIKTEYDGINQGLRDPEELLHLRYRCWEKDYFTAALPTPEAGVTGAILPLHKELQIEEYDPKTHEGTRWFDGSHDITGEQHEITAQNTVDISGSHKITGEISTSVQELRKAYKVQRWLEATARGGRRYIEQIFSHFGVKSSDARMQRPEYLGGGCMPLMVSEVIQQSETTPTSSEKQGSPLGAMAGKGLTVGKTNYFKRFFEEDGWVLGILSIIPKASYQQGLPRQFTRFDVLDYYSPEFANLGEQEIKQQEIFYDFNSDNEANNQKCFGYIPRWSEYKYVPNRTCGAFRDSLRYWHLSRMFSQAPGLNGSFVTVEPESAKDGNNRIFAYESTTNSDGSPSDHFWLQIYHNIRANRPLPYFDIPE